MGSQTWRGTHHCIPPLMWSSRSMSCSHFLHLIRLHHCRRFPSGSLRYEELASRRRKERMRKDIYKQLKRQGIPSPRVEMIPSHNGPVSPPPPFSLGGNASSQYGTGACFMQQRRRALGLFISVIRRPFEKALLCHRRQLPCSFSCTVSSHLSPLAQKNGPDVKDTISLKGATFQRLETYEGQEGHFLLLKGELQSPPPPRTPLPSCVRFFFSALMYVCPFNSVLDHARLHLRGQNNFVDVLPRSSAAPKSVLFCNPPLWPPFHSSYL